MRQIQTLSGTGSERTHATRAVPGHPDPRCTRLHWILKAAYGRQEYENERIAAAGKVEDAMRIYGLLSRVEHKEGIQDVRGGASWLHTREALHGSELVRAGGIVYARYLCLDRCCSRPGASRRRAPGTTNPVRRPMRKEGLVECQEYGGTYTTAAVLKEWHTRRDFETETS